MTGHSWSVFKNGLPGRKRQGLIYRQISSTVIYKQKSKQTV